MGSDFSCCFNDVSDGTELKVTSVLKKLDKPQSLKLRDSDSDIKNPRYIVPTYEKKTMYSNLNSKNGSVKTASKTSKSIRSSAESFNAPVKSIKSVKLDNSLLLKRIEDVKSINRLLLLFVIDVTGSMENYIKGTKELVNSIISDFGKKGLKINVGFVGYRDYSDEEQFVIMEYSEIFNREEFENKFVAKGGDDLPENLVGGLEIGLNLSFNTNDFFTKIIILIADSPCHGKKYHDLKDNYPDENGNLENITQKIAKRGFNLSFIQIGSSNTKKMAKIIQEVYDKNKVDNIKYVSFNFDIKTDDINKIITNLSVYFTSTVSNSIKFSYDSLKIGKTISSSDIILNVPWIEIKNHESENLKFEMYEYEISDFTNIDLEDITTISIKNILDKINFNSQFSDMLQISKKIFSKGSEHQVHQGVHNKRRYVIKIPRIEMEYKLKNFNDCKLGFLRIHIAKIILDKFNERLKDKSKFKFKFAQTYIGKLLEIEKHDFLNDNRYFYVEPFIENFMKFNNNGGWVNPSKSEINMLAQALSHFSFEFSSANLIICDLQGNETLTDVAIISRTKFMFGNLDGGFELIQLFFSTHKCNKFCKILELENLKFNSINTIIEEESDSENI